MKTPARLIRATAAAQDPAAFILTPEQQARRDWIITMAEAVFANHRPNTVTLQELATGLRISLNKLRFHFPDIPSLLAAVFINFWAPLNEALHAIPPDAPGAEATCRALYLAHIRRADGKNLKIFRIFSDFRYLLPPDLHDPIQAWHTSLIDRLGGFGPFTMLGVETFPGENLEASIVAAGEMHIAYAAQRMAEFLATRDEDRRRVAELQAIQTSGCEAQERSKAAAAARAKDRADAQAAKTAAAEAEAEAAKAAATAQAAPADQAATAAQAATAGHVPTAAQAAASIEATKAKPTTAPVAAAAAEVSAPTAAATPPAHTAKCSLPATKTPTPAAAKPPAPPTRSGPTTRHPRRAMKTPGTPKLWDEIWADIRSASKTAAADIDRDETTTTPTHANHPNRTSEKPHPPKITQLHPAKSENRPPAANQGTKPQPENTRQPSWKTG